MTEHTPTVTDDMVAEALDAKASMSQLHCYLYSTEKCRCGEEWTDAHWMRFILERALSRAGVVVEEPAKAEDDPAKDERLVRFMAIATPLGYQSALTVVQAMTLLIQAETEARRAGDVPEEPEWETECRRFSLHGGLPVWHERKVTPWVPVKQEGAADAEG